jgi:hypothetical protein
MHNIGPAIIVCLALSVSFVDAKPLGRGSCAADIKSHCSNVQPGGGRIAACIKEHIKDLSEDCQARLARAAAAGRACVDDVKKNCPDVKPGGGRIEACIKSVLANVSDACKDAVVKAVAGRK